jgi:hypothetical protein
MKLLNTIFLLTTCWTATVAAGIRVPGDSPLEFCSANRDQDLFVLEKVDISPNPPKAYGLDFLAAGTHAHLMTGEKV